MVDVFGYEGLYKIDKQGNVWSNNLKRYMSQIIDNKGYCRVYLTKDGNRKCLLVSRLVLKSFVPVENMDELQANHINENTTDNRLENLEWTTPIENSNHGTRNDRISNALSKNVLCIDTNISYINAKNASELTGINKDSIRKCCGGHRKTAGGYHWKYLNS